MKQIKNMKERYKHETTKNKNAVYKNVSDKSLGL